MAYRSVPWFVVFLYFICYTIQQDDDYRDMAFQKHVGWKLNLPNQMQQKTRKVRDEMHCAFACVQETWCLSVNFETTSLLPAERVHRCEILSSDRYTSKMDLQPDDQFIHLNIKVRLLLPKPFGHLLFLHFSFLSRDGISLVTVAMIYILRRIWLELNSEFSNSGHKNVILWTFYCLERKNDVTAILRCHEA